MDEDRREEFGRPHRASLVPRLRSRSTRSPKEGRHPIGAMEDMMQPNGSQVAILHQIKHCQFRQSLENMLPGAGQVNAAGDRL
jgi:hypothetical protein